MRVVLSDFGALVLSIEIPDANGLLRDVALGFEKIEDYYCTETGMGAYIGRNANRIKDAKVRINGEKGKYGCIYKKNTGICFETQFYPNSCNDRRFASPILAAGKNFKSRTIYQFDVE